jgi:hypothetical protein
MSDGLQVADSTTDKPVIEGEIVATDPVQNALIEELSKGKTRKYARFVMAALGSVPWIGALAALSAEKDQQKINDLLKLWIQEHEPKWQELTDTLRDIIGRLEAVGGSDEEVQQRLESPEYLSLVRGAFKGWDNAETAEKREYIKRLIGNAGATKLVPDDLVRLFIGWINTYHESHFAVIKQVYKNPGVTRGAIWDEVHTERPRDDSSEADLFKYLVDNLSLGHVIRQETEVRDDGTLMNRPRGYTPKGQGSKTRQSAFEDTKGYVLTQLGEKFIQYVLNDVVPRVEAPTNPTS